MAAKKARLTPVYLEVGKKRVFAGALDWPGWCRSGKTEEAALEALDAYQARYAVVAERAGIRFADVHTFDVVERLPGDASTEFGVPGAVARAHTEPVRKAEATRFTALVDAAWEVFDEVAADSPEELRKGPRGGGRDRTKMVNHVIEAEAAYGRMIGVRHRAPAVDDRPAIEALRADLRAVLVAPSDGEPLRPNGWPYRYAASRIAWHALDHAWEMQDRRT